MQDNQKLITSGARRNGNLLLFLIIIIHGAAVFFSDIFQMISLLELISLGLLIGYYVITGRKLIISKFAIPWFTFMIMVFLNIFVGADLNFVISFILFTLLFYGLMKIPNAGVYMLRVVKVFTCIHLIASLAVYFLPNTVIDPVFELLLGSRSNSNYYWRVISGYNAGLTTQPGANAIYLSTGLLIYYAKFLTEKKHRLRYIIILLLFSAMILTTGKRSTILFIPVTIVICTMVLTFKRKIRTTRSKLLLGFGSIALIVIVAVFFLNNSGLLEILIYKVNSLDTGNDSSNGRFDLWNMALNQFWEHPFLGIGLKSIYGQVGLDVHNSYIQILAEMGALSFVVFLVGLFGMLKEGYRQVRLIRNNSVQVRNPEIRIAKITGILLMVFLLLYGMVGNTFIDYLPTLEFYVAVILMCSYTST